MYASFCLDVQSAVFDQRPGEKFKQSKKRKNDELVSLAADSTTDAIADDDDARNSMSHVNGAGACVRHRLTASQMVIEATPMALRTPRDQVHLLK